MLIRNRRLRTSEAIRNLVRETVLTIHDFQAPLFVTEGKNIKEEIDSMPGYFRLSPDLLEKEVKELWDLGIQSVLLFVKVPQKLKDNKGTEALNPEGLMQRAVKTVKNAVPGMLVMTDVALDPYSSLGHDGIVEGGNQFRPRRNVLVTCPCRRRFCCAQRYDGWPDFENKGIVGQRRFSRYGDHEL